MGEHRRKQLIGVAGSLAGFATVMLAWAHPGWFAGLALPADDVATRLAFAVRWLLLPGLCLLFGIQGAASRGFYADAIDGTRTPASHRLEITLRYNINTVEQTVLAAIAWLGLAVALPHTQLWLIPAMALLFAAGRATFFIGYLITPMGRAYGMVVTAVPTLIAYAWLVGRIF